MFSPQYVLTLHPLVQHLNLPTFVCSVRLHLLLSLSLSKLVLPFHTYCKVSVIGLKCSHPIPHARRNHFSDKTSTLVQPRFCKSLPPQRPTQGFILTPKFPYSDFETAKLTEKLIRLCLNQF